MDTIIHNATIVNQGKIFVADVLISGERIKKIEPAIRLSTNKRHLEVDEERLYLIPS